MPFAPRGVADFGNHALYTATFPVKAIKQVQRAEVQPPVTQLGEHPDRTLGARARLLFDQSSYGICQWHGWVAKVILAPKSRRGDLGP
jgi:hypothetical protein